MNNVLVEWFAGISRRISRALLPAYGMVRLATRLPRPPTRFRPISAQSGVFSSLCMDRPDIISQCLFWLGRFEPWVALVASRVAEPGSVVIDVGANLGAMTIPLGHSVGDSGMVLSFEPDHVNFARLTDNIASNRLSNVRAQRCAVSTAARVQVVRPQNGDPGHIRTTPAGENLADSVEGISLDAICEHIAADRQQRISLCKIDVEGAEADVLASGHRSLAAKVIEAVLFESHQPVVTGHPLAELFRGYGYTAYRIHKTAYGACLVSTDVTSRRGIPTCDYLAVLGGSPAAARVSNLIVR
jgi:FkbM family methyltransferase